MKTIMGIYFSPTGNTEKIINTLIPENDLFQFRSFDITLKQNRDQLAQVIQSLDTLPDYWLFGSPVYSGQIPDIVRKTLTALEGFHIPTIGCLTYGNKSYGVALSQLKELLIRQHFNVIAMAAFAGEHSYSAKFHIAENRPDNVDKQQAAMFGTTVFASKIQGLQNGPVNGKIDFLARIMPKGGPKPFVDLNRCINCLKCAAHCPVEAIDPVSKSYRDTASRNDCLSCMSCVKKCPVNARSYHIPFLLEFVLNRFYFKSAKTNRHPPILVTGDIIAE